MTSYLQNLAGPKKYLATFLLGAVMTLCMAPLGVFPLLLGCVPGFIYLARAAKSKRGAFFTGWAFGAGYFIFGLYWISAALFVDIGQFGWVLPFSLILGPVAFALYYGFIPLLAWRYRKNITAYTFIFVTAWAAIEWLRGHLFTGFPWNLPGYTWMWSLPVMQMSAFAGIYGLTLLTLLWATVPVFILLPKGGGEKVSAALLCTFLLACGSGMARLNHFPTLQSGHDTVRIVQPNIPETMKWDRDEVKRNLELEARLSRAPTTLPTPVNVVVWPETAVAMDLSLYPGVAKFIASNLPYDSAGILGTLRVTGDDDNGRQYFNSVSLLTHKGRVAANYNKHHLVPFGEYIPFRGTFNLTPIAVTISSMGDFSRGSGPQTLAVGDIPPFSPLVCYEVIFPGVAVDPNRRPAWLVNVTNDAWYGQTAGPHQHFEIARVRAIEEGLPLARAANTGISGMIDPVGRVLAMKPLGLAGVVDAILPAPLPPTPYARYGDVSFFIMLVLMAGLGELSFRRRK